MGYSSFPTDQLMFSAWVKFCSCKLIVYRVRVVYVYYLPYSSHIFGLLLLGYEYWVTVFSNGVGSLAFSALPPTFHSERLSSTNISLLINYCFTLQAGSPFDAISEHHMVLQAVLTFINTHLGQVGLHVNDLSKDVSFLRKLLLISFRILIHFIEIVSVWVTITEESVQLI